MVITGVTFMAIGSAKSKWSTVSWWRSGLATLVVGTIAAALAYVAGMLLKDLLV
jgi:VIT1/CCC1 family predicted Fe2+/Mn2+ transporter